MIKDRHDHTLSGASIVALQGYEDAVTSFNLYRGDPMATLAEVTSSAPEFAMARMLKVCLLGLATEPDATIQARQELTSLKSIALNDRERSLSAALAMMLDGAWTQAAERLERHSSEHPRDLVALQVGHLIDFYRADALSLRDRIARVLPHWSHGTSDHSLVLGMHAFGLEEMGQYALAEETGRRAIAAQPLDCWAHHAVAHVMEMQGRAEDGIEWMKLREPHWSGDANFFKVHNWWHLALYHLELGEADQALSLYDAEIRKACSTVALDLVDASALLWRLHLTGHDTGTRWHELAQTWDAHADGGSYPFNDWHACMAYLGAGRHADLERILASLRALDTRGDEVAAWCRHIALPLVEGFVAFWRGDYAIAVERLHGLRHIANGFGGSHAQRDIIHWTLTEAAVRGGLRDVAHALVSERGTRKPHSPVNRSFVLRATSLRTPFQAS